MPFQSTAWRSAAFVVGKPGHTPVNALLEPALSITIAPEAFDNLYDSGTPEDLSLYPLLDDARRFHREAMVQSALRGDDYGNVTAFNPGAPAGYYGMNRLNHCPAIFEESYRASSAALRETAVQWCSNMHDLSIWWGDTPDCGGTRYNAAVAAGEKEHEGDTSYLWRTNWTSHFCTKGYDSFFYAYEETGDPRMLTALRHQVAYAKGFIHTNTGECRNIGDVVDFMRLYRYTGLTEYREEALRLFRELREKLSTGDLFDQGGKPIAEDVTFIDDDAAGLKAGYAKPYIIGYALAGLPDLLAEYPDEPKLRDVVRAVGDFLASSQDPVGGWRYPHPKSSGVIIGQGMEHAMQLVRSAKALEARGENISNMLDAIERTLQGRIDGYRISGQVLSGLTGWERSTNAIPEGKTIYDLYTKPGDRDPSRDYTEGAVSVGGSPPDGLAHFGEVLSFYLAHRPAERLFHRNFALSSVLARVPDQRLRLTPQDGAMIRIEDPANPETAITIPALAWANLTDTQATATSAWMSDAQTDAISLTLDRPEATYAAQFTPNVSHVDCTFTVWPKPGAELAKLDGTAPEVNWGGDASRAGWNSIESPRPETALLAFTNPDGQWVLGLASEAASNQGIPRHLNPQGPTSVRATVYIMKATPETLGACHDSDALRWHASQASVPSGLARTAEFGIRDLLPSFNAPSVTRMGYPVSWSSSHDDFFLWRNRARKAYIKTLQTPPPRAPFNPQVIAEEDRGTYIARKLAINISADERVKAYLLMPKGGGPFPAIVALHDHGAHFSIGKEKVIRPFGESEERVADAVDWVTKYYGGDFIGDELAKRGYVVFATDALFWGDRGRYGGVKYEDQQALGANMLQLGRSWAGNIVWDDIRSAEFVQSLAEVDADRIGCVGLSMGSHRTWSLAAATDIIKAGAAICWMGDTKTLASPGNNQTTGQSSFSMIHPGIRALLDYPDVASIACPKPMLFFNGTEDSLFPVPGVEAAYAKMRAVWESQGAGDRLETKLWPVPHEFNAAMQAEAFDWMDKWVKVGK
ncbi:MAG: dienelactone hydrolase family protein [Candidatus Hydrogenedentes bacterium]|nr:dienelactone hydrolase family protein [Candidatus Hydrogenedentota bacterium]